MKKGMFSHKLEDGSYDDKYGQNVHFKEWGQPPPGQGVHSNLQDAVNRLIAGEVTVYNLLQEDAQLVGRNKTAFEMAAVVYNRTLKARERKKPSCTWWCGPSGCGKSKGLFDKYGIMGVFRPNKADLARGFGWDGYWPSEDKHIIFDDIDGSLKFKIALNIMDPYPETVPQKGTSPIYIQMETIDFTSTLRPEEIWRQAMEDGEDFKQFYRRCTLKEWNTDTRQWDLIENPMHVGILAQQATANSIAAAFAPTFVPPEG